MTCKYHWQGKSLKKRALEANNNRYGQETPQTPITKTRKTMALRQSSKRRKDPSEFSPDQLDMEWLMGTEYACSPIESSAPGKESGQTSYLFPILITFICLGVGCWALLLGATWGSAHSPAHDIIARLTAGLRLLVVGSARLGSLSLDGFRLLCRGLDLGCRWGFRLVFRVVTPAYFFFLVDVGT